MLFELRLHRSHCINERLAVVSLGQHRPERSSKLQTFTTESSEQAWTDCL
jgi:hypothetical protein